MKLRDICNNNTAVQLREIAKSHGLNGYSKMKKAELIELLVGHLLDYDTIEESLLLAEQKELDAFDQVCKGMVQELKEDADDYVYFFMKGYYNINSNQEISVPDEVKRMYPVIVNDAFMKKRAYFHNILNYCKACVNLYGIVPVDHVLKLYNQNNKFEISKEELLSVVGQAQNRNCNVELKQENLVHELILTNERAYDVIQKKQEGKPYYIPPKGQLLSYADDNYVEGNEYYKNLLAYLKSVLFMSNEMAEACICEIEFYYSEGKDAADILAELQEQGLELSSNDQKQALLKEIVNYTNYVRLWENRGSNKVELGVATDSSNVINFNESAKTIVRTDKKVGRNDPCPCGSGKKYKFCCGR